MAKKKTLTAFIAVLLAFCIAAAVITAGGGQKVEAATGTFSPATGAGATVNLGHIADTHYFPLNYCYAGGDPNSEFHSSAVVSPKLILEAQLFNVQGFKNIEDFDFDYLMLSGDITYNGEIQGHYEMANLLRELQNNVRAKGKTDFQIFVVPGNHDMYNDRAARFDNASGSEASAGTVTRYDFAKIYAGLGYPDLSAEEADAFYSQKDIIKTNLPFASNSATATPYVLSDNADNIVYSYQFGNSNAADYDEGGLTYIAYVEDINYIFMGIDEELSSTPNGNVTAGRIPQATFDWIAEQSEDFAEGAQKIVIEHHNLIPHFAFEDTLLKDFTVYSWKEAADFFADEIGVRYCFSGHMHANDVESYVSFDGNTIIDTQTASLTGYYAGSRTVKIQRGTVDGVYAEDYSSTLHPITGMNLQKLVTDGFVTASYFADNGLTPYMSGYTVTDASEYAVTKLFRNIVDVYVNQFLNPDFIGGLGNMVSGIIPDKVFGLDFSAVKVLANSLIDNLIDHIEDVGLADYVYSGDNAALKTDVRGAKICGYLSELVYGLVDMKIGDSGLNFKDFVLGSYFDHIAGTNVPADQLAEADRLAIAALTNGSVIKTILNTLLDEDAGLMRIINCLLDSKINLGKGLSDADNRTISSLLSILSGVKAESIDAKAIDLEQIGPKIVVFIQELLGADIGFTADMKIKDFLDHILEDYVTESLYTGLGEIAGAIVYSFKVDESTDGAYGVWTHHLPTAGQSVTYIENSPLVDRSATVENGKLPGMLTVTFGEDTATEKNFVWFTDFRVTGSDIQYCLGEFNEQTATEVSGEYTCLATTTASIDLGIFATLLDLQVGRHQVELNNLKGGSTYSYRVGDSERGWWSKVSTFTTAPDEGTPFQTLLISDLQGFADITYQLANQALAQIGQIFPTGYDFVINCGDLVDNSRNLVQWKYLLNTMSDVWSNTTQVVSVGNHGAYSYEVSEKTPWYLTASHAVTTPYNYVLSHYYFEGATDSLTGAYYSFDYSSVHFTVLNTNDIDSSTKGLSAEQLAWLENDLSTTDKKFKVVVMHKGAYSSGAHSYDPDVISIREQVTSIFAENGVALVLQGHDHTYSESYYIDKDGNVVENNAKKKFELGTNGTLYVTIGTLGDKTYKYVENEAVPLAFGKQLHTPTLWGPTVGKLWFDGESLFYAGYIYDQNTEKFIEVHQAVLKDQIKYYGGLGLAILSALALICGPITAIVRKRKRII